MTSIYTPDNAAFQFKTAQEAQAFRETVSAMGLKWARPLYWHDNDKPFPKVVTGASCFFLRLRSRLVGVTAAHVVRLFELAKATTPSLVCQLHLMRFELGAVLIDVDDELDVARFAVSERDLKTSLAEPFDVSSSWPPNGVIERGAPIQLVGYPENIRMIDPSDRSAIFQAWGALDLVEDFTEREILLVYQPENARAAPIKPPLGYNMSGCSGGPAIIHGNRNGLHVWHPVGLIARGPRDGQGLPPSST